MDSGGTQEPGGRHGRPAVGERTPRSIRVDGLSSLPATPQRRQQRRLAVAARELITRMVTSSAGEADLAAAAGFYEALGWRRTPAPEGVVAFDLIGQTLALYELEDLARDLGIDSAALGHGAMTLAHNVRTRDEVAPLMARAEAAGARILRPAGEIFWGGVIGYFADPEGHIWEIAWNPGAPLSHTGEFRWNGYP